MNYKLLLIERTQLKPLGCRLLPIETDENGIIPSSLKRILSSWTPRCPDEATADAGRVPKIIYTVPNGVNPTGASLSLSRKKEIYEVPECSLLFETEATSHQILWSFLS